MANFLFLKRNICNFSSLKCDYFLLNSFFNQNLIHKMMATYYRVSPEHMISLYRYPSFPLRRKFARRINLLLLLLWIWGLVLEIWNSFLRIQMKNLEKSLGYKKSSELFKFRGNRAVKTGSRPKYWNLGFFARNLGFWFRFSCLTTKYKNKN